MKSCKEVTKNLFSKKIYKMAYEFLRNTNIYNAIFYDKELFIQCNCKVTCDTQVKKKTSLLGEKQYFYLHICK